MKIIGYAYLKKENLDNASTFSLSLSPLRSLLKSIDGEEESKIFIQLTTDVENISNLTLYPMNLSDGVEYIESDEDDSYEYFKYPPSFESISDLYDRGGYIAYFDAEKSNSKVEIINDIKSFIVNYYSRDNFTIVTGSESRTNNLLFYALYPDTVIDEPPVSYNSENYQKRCKNLYLNNYDFVSKYKYPSHNMFNCDAIFDCIGSEYAIKCKDSAVLVKGNDNVFIIECDYTGIMITGDNNTIICLADDVTIIDLGNNNKYLSHITTNRIINSI